MNISLLPEQFDELAALVDNLITAATKQWRNQPEKLEKSMRTYQGIREFAEEVGMLTDNQLRVLVTGAKMLKQTVPLWLQLEARNTTSANVLVKPTAALNLHAAGFDLPCENGDTKATPDIAKLLTDFTQYMVDLHSRICVLENKLQCKK